MTNFAMFGDRYTTALGDFLTVLDEVGLEQAYELGREAIANGLGVLDLAAIHTVAVRSELISSLELPRDEPARSWQFFAEALGPFEMALRGFRAANVALKDAAATLEERVASRTRELATAERALREQARILRSVVDSISDGIAVADESGKFLLSNRSAERFLGMGTSDALTERWSSTYGIFGPDMATPLPLAESPIVRAIAGEQTEAVPMFVRNHVIPVGVHLSVIGSPLRNDEGRTEGGVVVFRDVTEARRAEDVLRKSEERFRLMFEASPLPMWTVDLATLAFVSVNDAALRHYGFRREEFSTMTVADILPRKGTALPDRDELVRSISEGTWNHRKRDGSIITVEIMANDFQLAGKQKRLVLATDVTERVRAQEALRKTEEQLRQSQKMDAIGRLAGGVAHDFNNILSVIISYSEMLLVDLEPDFALREDIVEINKAGKRAADLTRQLLMFSRQQVLESKIIDLNSLLAEMDRMLKRLLGEDVDLASFPARGLGLVRADPGSIEQVILNLVVNARDAMPTGGQITIETDNVVLDEQYASQNPGAQPGRHVMLAVTDTGHGMDAETKSRIFEPFFTTKGTGKGTGLGLSTVFGIVQQSGGTVWVYSEVGRGTTFKVYLPRVGTTSEERPSSPPPATMRGAETILLVDDDDQVRAVTQAILRRNGYRVIEARNAGEAILQSEKHAGPIHLLLTDVVMPQMSGPLLAQRLNVQRPDMRVLCMSGYTDDSIVRHGVLEAHLAYLQKPVTPQSLTMKVRAVLEEISEPHPPAPCNVLAQDTKDDSVDSVKGFEQKTS